MSPRAHPKVAQGVASVVIGSVIFEPRIPVIHHRVFTAIRIFFAPVPDAVIMVGTRLHFGCTLIHLVRRERHTSQYVVFHMSKHKLAFHIEA